MICYFYAQNIKEMINVYILALFRFTWKKLEYKLEVQKPSDGEAETLDEGPPESQNITHVDDGDLITPPDTPGGVKHSQTVIKPDSKTPPRDES